ncbi:nucleolar protein 9 [Melanerpes formicivorus]|uniref:nucleolar protein 9 n=1 Tax=Melanerpes formicivorus TaxID=211600 RepID=UPI00358F4481
MGVRRDRGHRYRHDHRAQAKPKVAPGPRLEPEAAGYCRRALETLQEGLGPEELALFTPNVLGQLQALGLGEVSQDFWGSQLLEQLLPGTPPQLLAQLLPSLLLGGLGGPAGHPLGARVVEAALGRLGEGGEVQGQGGEAKGQLEGTGEELGGTGRRLGKAKRGLGGAGEELGGTEDGLGGSGEGLEGTGRRLGKAKRGLGGPGEGEGKAKKRLGGPGGEVEELGAPLGATGRQLAAALGQLVALVGGDLVAFAQHPPGSFVLRALLRLLGGTRGAGPELLRLAEAFQKHFPALLAPPCASLCLQEALQVLHHSQSEAGDCLCQALIGYLVPPSPDPTRSSLLAGLQDPERSRLLEAAMMWAGPECLRALFQQLKGHLRAVANHRLANHGLQRLLDHAPRDVVEEVLRELGPALHEPLAQGHPGVLTALAGACRRHPELQQEALRCLFQAFGCWEPPERRKGCVGLLIGLRSWAGGDQPEGAEPVLPAVTSTTLQGSLLLQHLLAFRDPQPLLAAFQALDPAQLVSLAQSGPGSHLWEALLGCPHLAPKARRKLLKKLKGHFLSLACHRNGSRVLEAAWGWASLPTRASIARELAANQEALQRDPHGRGIHRSLALDLFLRRRGSWEKLQAAPRRPQPFLQD